MSWLLWFFSYGSLIGIDYLLRTQDDNIKTGGIPDSFYLIVFVVLSGIAIYINYLGLKKIKTHFRLILLMDQCVFGYFIAAFIGLYYVCFSGIDCM